jgi:hypothetical protein
VWKQPKSVTTAVTAVLWQLATRRRTSGIAFDYPESAEVERLVTEMMTPILTGVETGSPQSVPPPYYQRRVSETLVLVAREIEERRLYNLLPVLESIPGLLAQGNQVESDFGILLTCALKAIHLLLGDERRVLVGCRDGQPALKRQQRAFHSSLSAEQLVEVGLMEWPYLPHIEQADVDIVPDSTEMVDINWLRGYNWPQIEQTTIQRLFEAAYYEQCYVVHPAGAYVRLRHFGPFSGLTLKVKPGLRDPKYLDLLAIFETAKGKHPVVIDGAYITGVEQLGRFEGEELFYEYLCWVTGVIYHDLVTAETIRVGSSEQEATPSVWPSDDELPEPSWIYIPRQLRLGEAQPRAEIAGPRIMMPHHVSGHMRKGNLTEAHREELQDFERETGLRVLNLLARHPGKTFVRPHVSPSVEGLNELPRFIHARLQSDIERMMDTSTAPGA